MQERFRSHGRVDTAPPSRLEEVFWVSGQNSRARALSKSALTFDSQKLSHRTRTRTNTHPHDTKASAACKRGEWRANFERSKNQEPCMPLQHAKRLSFRWLPRSKGYFCISMHISLPGVPVTSASRLPGVELAVLLLLLAPELGQRQPNYQHFKEELREGGSTALENRKLLHGTCTMVFIFASSRPPSHARRTPRSCCSARVPTKTLYAAFGEFS